MPHPTPLVARLRGHDGLFWLPACAGMTVCSGCPLAAANTPPTPYFFVNITLHYVDTGSPTTGIYVLTQAGARYSVLMADAKLSAQICHCEETSEQGVALSF